MLEMLPIAVPETAGPHPSGTAFGILPALANRHGLITGATGTGKTVTLQLMAERLSAIGVPVVAADVKGDLSGIAKPGHASAKFDARVAAIGVEAPLFAACPVTFWDVFGTKGHPLRATVSDMGPLLLARMLDLNDTQGAVLNLVFKIADDNGLLLLDAKDLRAMLQYVGDNASSFQTQYGNISAASIGAIQRGLMAIESQGADRFFGEPMLDLDDFLQTIGGRGVVNILAVDQLMNAPRLYATFLLWLLSELFEKLPEIGDPDKPKLVFFFDEAHLLFTDAPKALLEKIEQVVRLVRSKGVGIYFITQNPLDIPDTVLGQLGNRVQHALRAFTPRDQAAVKAAATTMRPKPGLDVVAAITELGVGEALVSFLDAAGRPLPTERVQILPPSGQIGAIDDVERQTLIASSLVVGVYEKVVDRESAYEIIRGRVEATAVPGAVVAPAAAPTSTPAVRTPTLPVPTAAAPAAARPAAPVAPVAPVTPAAGIASSSSLASPVDTSHAMAAPAVAPAPAAPVEALPPVIDTARRVAPAAVSTASPAPVPAAPLLRPGAPRAVAAALVPATVGDSDDSDPPWGDEEPDILEDDLPSPTRGRSSSNAGVQPSVAARRPSYDEPDDIAASMAPAPASASRAAAPSVAMPPASPTFERTALGTRWYELIAECSAAGSLVALVRALAMQSELLECEATGDAPVWRLRVGLETLRNPALVEKLAVILRNHLGQNVQLVVESGEAQDCPLKRDTAESERRQRAAIDTIQSDPTVRALLAQFQTARILPGSIKPL